MRQPVKSGAPRNNVVIPFEGDDVNNLVRELIDTIKETNEHLGSIAGVGQDTLGFVKKWVPWIIAAAGLLYPALGKVIQGLPSLPV